MAKPFTDLDLGDDLSSHNMSCLCIHHLDTEPELF